MLRIIIADDHPVVRQGLKEILKEEFSSVYIEEAEDTDSLVTKALSDNWDLVISDLAMPGGGGVEALKKIRTVKFTLPVIILSTYSVEQYESRVLRAGAQRFISKDSLPNGLLQAIQTILHDKLQAM